MVNGVATSLENVQCSFSLLIAYLARRAFVEILPYFCDFARLFVILGTFRAIFFVQKTLVFLQK